MNTVGIFAFQLYSGLIIKVINWTSSLTETGGNHQHEMNLMNEMIEWMSISQTDSMKNNLT